MFLRGRHASFCIRSRFTGEDRGDPGPGPLLRKSNDNWKPEPKIIDSRREEKREEKRREKRRERREEREERRINYLLGTIHGLFWLIFLRGVHGIEWGGCRKSGLLESRGHQSAMRGVSSFPVDLVCEVHPPRNPAQKTLEFFFFSV